MPHKPCAFVFHRRHLFLCDTYYDHDSQNSSPIVSSMSPLSLLYTAKLVSLVLLLFRLCFRCRLCLTCIPFLRLKRYFLFFEFSVLNDVDKYVKTYGTIQCSIGEYDGSTSPSWSYISKKLLIKISNLTRLDHSRQNDHIKLFLGFTSFHHIRPGYILFFEWLIFT